MMLIRRSVQDIIALTICGTLLASNAVTPIAAAASDGYIPAVKNAVTASRSLGRQAETDVPTAVTIGAKVNAPRDMKLLVITLTGTEPDHTAIKFFVETLGIPYKTAITLNTAVAAGAPPIQQPLPPLTDPTGTRGLYQGIILTDGNLGYCYNGTSGQICQSAISPADWTTLENYCRDFGVRLVSYYTFPEARYGLSYDHAQATTEAAPVSATFTASAPALFPYLNTANPLRIANSYMYYAKAAPGPGETTVPFLTVGGFVAGAINTKSDGREYMALTMDNNPNLQHSQILNYGIINWVTKGIFLGGRKVYLTPQVDDVFLANDQYVQGAASCTPSGFVNDPTFDPANACPTLRITGTDLKTLADWQKTWNANPQFIRFKVTHAFNGYGAADANGIPLSTDDLVNQATALRGSFYWINHTWDHEDLDCYDPAPNAGASTCKAATYNQSLAEIGENVKLAQQLTLPLDKTAMVTPSISGLKNPGFLQAAADLGIKYLVSDSSHPEYLPAIPNTGIRNPYQSSILMIPRRPMNIFYNTSTAVIGGPGSLPDEYNYFYGPNGIFRIGGTTGTPFFSTTQTYSDIINRESDALVTYMLRSEIYPQMYHQSNLYRYNGRNSLLSDVHDLALSKFAKISNLPVISLPQTDLGHELEARMAVTTAQINGVLTPGSGITLTGVGAALAPVTGICFGTQCESYGGQCISKVQVNPGVGATIPISAVTGSCPVNSGVQDPGGPSSSDPISPTPSSPYGMVRTAGDHIKSLGKNYPLTAQDIAHLNAAANAVNDSIDPALWIDMSRLLSPDGIAFYNAQKIVMAQLALTVTDPQSKAPSALVRSLLAGLLSVNRSIASSAITLARQINAAGSTMAQRELQNGDDSAVQGKYDEAVGHYGRAWSLAEAAIDSTL